jgi:uncharacterized protein YukE
MPYRKKTASTAIANAKVRISGLKSINPTLDLGNGMSIEAYETTLQDAQQKIEAYNTALANLGALQTAARDAEKDLSQFSERILSTVAGRYSKSSDEYEMAGGTKRTNHRRPKKKTETPSEEMPLSA